MTRDNRIDHDGADWLEHRRAMEKTLTDAGVYSPEMEHDACGVGLVAAIDGKPRREVVEKGIEAVSYTHLTLPTICTV